MRDLFDINEVFDNYASQMEKLGGLSSTASYSLPKNLLDGDKYQEIDLSQELEALALKGGLQITAEPKGKDVLSGAHPEGSPEIVKAPDGLGVVETKEDAHKQMAEIATKKTKLAQVILAFAAELDDAGLASFAQEIDIAVAKWMGSQVKMANDVAGEQQAAKAQLATLIATALDGNNFLLKHYKGYLEDKVNKADPDDLVGSYREVMRHLGSLPEMKSNFELMSEAWPVVEELSKRAHAVSPLQ